MYQRVIKRFLDIAVAIAAVTVLAPLLLLIAALVRLGHGRPVLFRQKRIGRNERIFTIYKFRTMTDDRDENGRLLPDTARQTRFGRFLRASSLDELPELFNILKGDMSLIGPRPLVERYRRCFTAQERRRHTVRPGLSGWAQVNGRNRADWGIRFACDLWYVDHCSFWVDLKIFFLTAAAVLRRENICTRGVDSPVDLDQRPKAGKPAAKEESP